MKNVLDRAAENNSTFKVMSFQAKQKMDYDFKVKYAEVRAKEFYYHPEIAGQCYVAVGGLDSITLLLFLRHIGIDVPAVSVSVLEDKSIQKVHNQLVGETCQAEWATVRSFGDCKTDSGCSCCHELYGKTWIAYRRPPDGEEET